MHQQPGGFLTAKWRYLTMLNYEIDPAVLRPYLPAGTELDSWNGTTFVSMVGFLFIKTRLLGIPIPLHQHFEEVNLRFYVRRKGPEGWRRGVVFIKEIVPRIAIATLARAVYNEQYVALPMSHYLEVKAGTLIPDGIVEYGWHYQGSWQHLRATTCATPQPIAAGSEEEFITEHYWGYAAQRDGSTVEYRVEHPRWQVWQVSASSLVCDVAALYGRQFVEALAGTPTSAFVAAGSAVTVHQGKRM